MVQDGYFKKKHQLLHKCFSKGMAGTKVGEEAEWKNKTQISMEELRFQIFSKVGTMILMFTRI
jgi:hypothetical protein